MKEHHFVVRFTTGQRTISSDINKRLKGVRRIALSQYHIDGLAAPGVSRTWLIRFEDFSVDQTHSFNGLGYAISAIPRDANTTHTVFSPPVNVYNQPTPVMQRVTTTLTDHAGASVTMTEATFWFIIYYDDDYSDLNVLAAESRILNPVYGANNWRSPEVPSMDDATQTMQSMTDHVFSFLGSSSK